jgi:hypothetical protein
MSTFLELEMKVEFSYLIFGPLYVSLISHHIPIVVYKTHDQDFAASLITSGSTQPHI